ncbi:MAG: pyruvate kinase, partial [Candidatus Omnitrophota bacterium]
IANAVLDGTDCLMLSEETAIGKYPVEAVSTLRKVSLITEKNFPHRKYLTQRIKKDISPLEAISYSAVWTAERLNSEAIVVPTFTGETARWISKFRPKAPIFAFTYKKNILRRLNLFWGVYPIFFPLRISLEKLPAEIEAFFRKRNILKRGAKIVITGSNPMGREGKTNLVQVHQIR